MKKIFLAMLIIFIFLTSCSIRPDTTTGDMSDSPNTDIGGAIIEHDDLFAVTIDNNPSARPQTGLNQAQRIYELPVEGGFTRFLVFFRYEAVDKIGPVRSAREEIVDLLLPYNSSFAHCGGSSAAISRIREDLEKDLCEINNSPFVFYRDSTRQAPHNLYTSTELLNKGFNQRGFTKESNFTFVDTLDSNFSQSVHKHIFLDYFTSSNYNYKISYEYDSVNEHYIRYTNDTPHQLTDDNYLLTNGVVFLMVDPIPQSNGFQTIGDNTAYIAYQGQHLETKWRRSSINQHFEFLIDGNYIEINNPNFIYHFIPTGKTVNFH